LLEYLKSNGVNRLVIIGMQTHMCLEAATRAAHDFGFDCIVVGDACATRDLTFGDKVVKAEDVHNSTLATIAGGGYGKVIELKTFKADPDTYIFK
jgi:nicotinamidase-related amidase